MKTDKIVILGGGSAGWMSAATLIKAFPDKDITVIESPNVPKIGVGEATQGQFKRWTRFIGLDENDFIPHTDATYKMSIKFTDFHTKDSGEFHYPFGLPYQEDSEDLVFPNWYAVRMLHPELEPRSFVELMFPASSLWDSNKYNPNENGELGNFNPEIDVAYHFDAIKFSLWLRDRYCLPRGVKHVQKHMDHPEVGEDGIEALVMEDGERIVADLYVDCTGFNALLIDKALHEPFTPYDHILLNNSAWACPIPYKDKELEMQAYTNCTAIGHGWCWNVPLWTRIGTGYNYSDKYISDEEALEEFKDYLCSDKMVVPRTREELEGLPFRNIKTRIGVHERTFVKNVVAIGLSAGFIEPLESNGLYSVHEFLFVLVKMLGRGGIVTEFDRLWYNQEVTDMFDGFAKFVAMHYAMSQRDDTDYWRDISKMQYTEVRGGDYVTRNMYRSASFLGAQKAFFGDYRDNQNLGNGVLYITAGMNYNPLFGYEWQDLTLNDGEFEKKIERLYRYWQERKSKWDEVANNSPKMIDYMRDHFFKE